MGDNSIHYSFASLIATPQRTQENGEPDAHDESQHERVEGGSSDRSDEPKAKVPPPGGRLVKRSGLFGGALSGLGESRRTVPKARFITGGGYRLLASGNFGELVLGCIEANSCHLLVAAEVP